MTRGNWILALGLLLACALAAWLLTTGEGNNVLEQEGAEPVDVGAARTSVSLAGSDAIEDEVKTGFFGSPGAGPRTVIVEVRSENGLLGGATVGTLAWFDSEGNYESRPRLQTLGRTGPGGRVRVLVPARFGALVAAAPKHHTGIIDLMPGQRAARVELLVARKVAHYVVQDEKGVRVPDALLTLKEPGASIPVERVTDEDGFASLPIPDFGLCEVQVGAEGFHSSVSWIRTQEVRDKQRFEYVIRRAPDVQGRVMDAQSEEPLAGAVVSNGFGTVVTTGTDGAFTIPCSSFVTVDAAGYYRASTRPSRWLSMRMNKRHGQRQLEQFAGNTLAGRVRGADGSPLVGAKVSSFGTATTKTDAEGRFEILGLGPWWQIQVYDHDGWTLWLRGANEAGPLDIRFPARVRVEGRVRFPEQSEKGATAVMMSGGSGPELAGACKPSLAGVHVVPPSPHLMTDAQGRFAIDNVPVGRYHFNVNPLPALGLLASGQTARVEAGMAPLVFDLRAGGVTRFLVLDDKGQPIPRARITTWANGRAVRRHTDEAGRAFVSGLPEQKQSFQIESALGRQTVSLAPGDHTVRFKATPRINVSLAREPIPDGTNCTIEISRKEGAGMWTTSGIAVDGSVEAPLPQLDPSEAYEVGIKAKGAGVKGEGFYSPWADLQLAKDASAASATVRVFRWDEEEEGE